MNDKLYGWNKELMGEVDHRKVKAAYIRLTSINNADSVIISVMDLRFTQPNVNRLKTNAAHSLEHMLAVAFRDEIPNNYVNLGPMGCLTGYYLTLVNFIESDEVLNLYEKVLHKILQFDAVPLCNEVQCGWAADHSLEGAKAEAEKVLVEKSRWREVYHG